jgi:hypothetical protein
MCLRPVFIVTVPDDLEEGVLYVSMTYATAIHLCACGCREEVVTPISPNDWQLGYDGEEISLTPSIGNWRLPCRSHYWISGGRVDWAADSGVAPPPTPHLPASGESAGAGLLTRIRHRLARLFRQA